MFQQAYCETFNMEIQQSYRSDVTGVSTETRLAGAQWQALGMTSVAQCVSSLHLLAVFAPTFVRW